MITLTNARRAATVCRERKALFLVSLLSQDFMISTPVGIDSRQHLKIVVDDKVTASESYDYPNDDHIRRLIEFGDSWDANEELVIHCWEGRSRSPAALMVLLAQKNPGHEPEITADLSRRAPHILPNRLIVEIGDRLLGCQGRLVAALETVPRGPDLDFDSYISSPVRWKASAP